MFKVVVDHGHLAGHLTGWGHKSPSESVKGTSWHLPVFAAGYPAFVFKQGCFARLALSLGRDRRRAPPTSSSLPKVQAAWRGADFAPGVLDHLSVG